MNNFKKFVAVLLGVVMACVFATSAFAADVLNTAKAKATIQGFLAQKGVTTLSRTVDSLTPSQLATIRDNQSALVNAVNNTASSVAGTADANSATRASRPSMVCCLPASVLSLSLTSLMLPS